MQLKVTELNKAEILRYLGWRGNELPPSMRELIDACVEETLSAISPKCLFRSFPIRLTDGGAEVLGAGFVLSGKSIERHLSGCREAYLLCVTVGLEIEKIIRFKMLASPDAGVILDSCASTAVEAAADLTEELIRQKCAEEGKSITSRFSPGYGDLPLTAQKELLSVLDSHRKIGLGLTPSLLLTPNKSVTAVIGVKEDKTFCEEKSKCDGCNLKDACSYRKN